MNFEKILGIDESEMVPFQSRYAWTSQQFRIHKKVVEKLELLCEAAYKDNFKLALISGYRSYKRQVAIWEEKCNGTREILDKNAHPINSFESDEEKYCAISQWSAIPGASRHHWGTDIDIFDATSLENDYHLKLIPEEFSSEGPCGKLNIWLDQNLSTFGFFRPYFLPEYRVSDLSINFKNNKEQPAIKAINSEPWHISYLPIAKDYIQYITAEMLLETWSHFPFSASDWAKTNVKTICNLLGT